MFRTNWKPNTQYTISFDMYGSTTSSNFAIRYTDNTIDSPSLGVASTWEHITITSDANKTIKFITPVWDQRKLLYRFRYIPNRRRNNRIYI